jgi:hypothetical protein
MWIWNFIEFIRFFQKGLNPFKIHGRFKFEFILEFITCNPLGFNLIQKVNLLLVFQSIDLQNLDIRKVTNSNIKVWVFEILDK